MRRNSQKRKSQINKRRRRTVRDTVVGEALLMSSVSKISLRCSDRCSLSPFSNVKYCTEHSDHGINILVHYEGAARSTSLHNPGHKPQSLNSRLIN